MTLITNIAQFLQLHGPAKAPEIATALNTSQSSLSRALKHREQTGIIQIGRARSTTYAVRRTISSVEIPVPLYEFQSNGTSHHLGDLYPVAPRGYIFDSQSDTLQGYYDDLPYFLDDMRPLGFLGRLIPRRHPELELAYDIRMWSGDQCLQYLTRYGHDHLGAFVLGNQPFQRALLDEYSSNTLIKEEDRDARYRDLAEDILSHGSPGSSAAGEQPKFLVNIEGRGALLVKFSPPIDSEIGRRRADLLVAEHCASKTLSQVGRSVADTALFHTEKRAYLEVKRFDRVGTLGRRGVISLHALDSEFVGSLTSWENTAEELRAQQIISEDTLKEIRWRAAFGALIGNSDMHHGNLSFYMNGGTVGEIAPIYDMLPMAYAPRNEQVVEVSFEPPIPSPKNGALWKSAWESALVFWDSLAREERVSSGFAQIARENRKKLEEMRSVLERLPAGR